MEIDETAFAAIAREYKATIYTVCYMFSKDKEEVADLFQEVLINLWNGRKGFRGDSNMKTWIYRISLNTCITMERKKRKTPTIPLTMDIDLYEDTDTDSRQVQQLYRRINKLEHFDRALILLWLENMSYDEIAAVLGITPKNVSVRLVRIKEELKKMNDV